MKFRKWFKIFCRCCFWVPVVVAACLGLFYAVSWPLLVWPHTGIPFLVWFGTLVVFGVSFIWYVMDEEGILDDPEEDEEECTTTNP